MELTAIKRAYELDFRSIAIFRISLALILLYDLLLTRFPYYELFHTELGVAPRFILFQTFKNLKTHSIDILSGSNLSFFIIGFLFFISILSLLVGYKSKISSFICFFFLVSFHENNPLIINSGDILLKLFLFYSCFLPLSGAYSIDYAISKNPPPAKLQFFHISSIAIIFQLIIIYLSTFYLKNHPIWLEGKAVYYALNIDEMRKPFGELLLESPHLMKSISFITFWGFEFFIPLVTFLAFYKTYTIRIISITLMCFFHLGLHFSMLLGTFPFVCISGWILLLPPTFWDYLYKKISVNKSKKTIINNIYISLSKIKVKINFTIRKIFFQSSSDLLRIPLKKFSLLFLVYIVTFIIFNRNIYDIEKTYLPFNLDNIGKVLKINQIWPMFAPHPHDFSTLIIFIGELKNGEKIDIFRSIKKQMPKWQYKEFPSFRHRKLMENLLYHPAYSKHLDQFKHYLCYWWNNKTSKDKKIVSIEIFAFVTKTIKNKYTSSEKISFGQKRCKQN